MAKRKETVQVGEVPKWVHDYFERAYESHTLLTRVVAISRKGIGGVTAMPRLTKAVARISGRERTPEELAILEEEAALASSELEKEFPVLHSLAVTGLWSWLEHFVKGIAVEWLLHHKKALSLPCFQRVKVRVGEYGTLSKREQAAYLIDSLEQDVAAALKHGVNRFESIFESLELSGKVKQSTAESIYELQQVRNVVAHRNGITDRRLRMACPKLKLKIGEPIRISARQFQSYSAATADYALTVLFRLGDRHGVELRTTVDDT
jgi:hypothetical protein